MTVSRRRLAHLLLAVAGLLVAIYPFTLGADPAVTCRGVELSPGETCAKADGSAAQSYEARAAAARNAAPVIVASGCWWRSSAPGCSSLTFVAIDSGSAPTRAEPQPEVTKAQAGSSASAAAIRAGRAR